MIPSVTIGRRHLGSASWTGITTARHRSAGTPPYPAIGYERGTERALRSRRLGGAGTRRRCSAAMPAYPRRAVAEVFEEVPPVCQVAHESAVAVLVARPAVAPSGHLAGRVGR